MMIWQKRYGWTVTLAAISVKYLMLHSSVIKLGLLSFLYVT
jgi:hypothetical protein